MINQFTDTVAEHREQKVISRVDGRVQFYEEGILEGIRKHGSNIYSLLSIRTESIIKESELYPVSSIIISYVMDPVMWDIKHRISECKYEQEYIRGRPTSGLLIIYNNTYKGIHLIPKVDPQYQGEEMQLTLDDDGGRTSINQITFPCKIKELTGDNFMEMTKLKEGLV